MNKNRQLRLELLDSITYNEDGVSRDIVSQKPYTFVAVSVDAPDATGNPREIIGYGFSKVCYPDVFDYHTGVSIATAKAVHDVVEQMWAL